MNGDKNRLPDTLLSTVIELWFLGILLTFGLLWCIGAF
jgi:hypothetical protein